MTKYVSLLRYVAGNKQIRVDDEDLARLENLYEFARQSGDPRISKLSFPTVAKIAFSVGISSLEAEWNVKKRAKK